MTQTRLLPPQRGSFPPFLPYNFYEAPQYAQYRPADTTTLAPLVAVSVGTDVAIEPPVVRMKRRSEVTRQVTRERQQRAEEIHGWLDNQLLIAENTVAEVTDVTAKTTPCGSDRLALISAVTTPTKKGRGRPKKIVANRLKPYLQNFIYAAQALERLPDFDNIVTGAVHLDAGNNTRPLSKKMMVSLLQVLDEITTDTVQQALHGSVRHAQRIAQCLRIIERAGLKVAQHRWSVPPEIDWSDFD